MDEAIPTDRGTDVIHSSFLTGLWPLMMYNQFGPSLNALKRSQARATRTYLSMTKCVLSSLKR